MEKTVRTRLPNDMRVRFLKALDGNKDTQERLLQKWIVDYVETYEEDTAAKRLHEEANLLKVKKATTLN